MMQNEFIERTKFEPTAEEYAEIENEYMGTELDKDAFCKMWKKQGGAERLMRLRARRIEELEAEVAKKDKLFEDRTAADARRYKELFDKDRKQMQKMEQEITVLNQTLEDFKEIHNQMKNKGTEAERKLAVLREAFAIITGKEE